MVNVFFKILSIEASTQTEATQPSASAPLPSIDPDFHPPCKFCSYFRLYKVLWCLKTSITNIYVYYKGPFWRLNNVLCQHVDSSWYVNI